ncbi:MAG TPA: ChbG/HpnK family deacetylase [Terriglobales bacterium]|nr:ChbG/HpnK family deacetylase [Terriglobales bacterium]
MRRLIVNADDFGLTPGVNRAILEAHTRGIVTSATLMANASAFDHAVQLARSAPSFDLGCHIVLVDGWPVLPGAEIPSLLDGGRQGEFERNLSSFAARAIRGRLNPEEVEREAIAQISKLQAANIPVSHIDTHKHLHALPQILRPLLRAAKACGVSAIRNPVGRIAFSLIAGRPKLWKRWGEVAVLNALASKFCRAVQAEGIITPNGSLGIAGTGVLDEPLFRLVLENIPEGTWEFVTHPGYNDADLRRVRTRLRHSREIELRLLASAETRESLARDGIELISYRNLL